MSRSKFRQARKRFESAKKKSLKDIPESLLSAGVAHEFNNILGAADGHAEWALESGDPKDYKTALEVVREACARAHRVTKALQSFAEPSEEKLKTFFVRDVVQDVVKLMQPRLLEAKVDGEFVEESATPLKIHFVESFFHEILMNLVKNAMEAFEEAEVPTAKRKMRIRVWKKGKKTFVSVEDRGTGVPKLFERKLFQPFFTTKGVLSHTHKGGQGTGSMKVDKRGTGLGLYWSRLILRQHGGELSYARKGGWTKFQIEI